jgi:hypothetical protein
MIAFWGYLLRSFWMGPRQAVHPGQAGLAETPRHNFLHANPTLFDTYCVCCIEVHSWLLTWLFRPLGCSAVFAGQVAHDVAALDRGSDDIDDVPGLVQRSSCCKL